MESSVTITKKFPCTDVEVLPSLEEGCRYLSVSRDRAIRAIITGTPIGDYFIEWSTQSCPEKTKAIEQTYLARMARQKDLKRAKRKRRRHAASKVL